MNIIYMIVTDVFQTFFCCFTSYHCMIVILSIRCMQCIIEEQLRNINNTLMDIETLENATLTAEERLSTIRASHRQKVSNYNQ